MKRQDDTARADELRFKHSISFEKALRHARERNISYVQAVKELTEEQRKKRTV